MNIAERCERCWTGVKGHNQALCDIAWNAYCQNIEPKCLTHTHALLHDSSSQEEFMDKNKRLRCPNCQSTLFYFRSRTNDFMCRGCGESFTKEEIKKKAAKKDLPAA